jgi:hypothetical protein
MAAVTETLRLSQQENTAINEKLRLSQQENTALKAQLQALRDGVQKVLRESSMSLLHSSIASPAHTLRAPEVASDGATAGSMASTSLAPEFMAIQHNGQPVLDSAALLFSEPNYGLDDPFLFENISSRLLEPAPQSQGDQRNETRDYWDLGELGSLDFLSTWDAPRVTLGHQDTEGVLRVSGEASQQWIT